MKLSQKGKEEEREKIKQKRKHRDIEKFPSMYSSQDNR